MGHAPLPDGARPVRAGVCRTRTSSQLVAERLSFPERAVIVSVPLRRDDGRIQIFAGYRVQHSTVLGPTKGGIRYDSEVSLGDVRGARLVDDVENARCCGCRTVGRKAGIRCDPRALSPRRVEKLTRRFTSELVREIGPQTDIPAPDMATNEQDDAWMMDTYSMLMGHAVPEVVTGKPISVGGSIFRREATGAGVVMTAERACHRLGLELAGQRCVVQGFGNVGGLSPRRSCTTRARSWSRSRTSRGASSIPSASTSPNCTRGRSSTARSPSIRTASGSRTRSCSSFPATSCSSVRERISSRPRTPDASMRS